MTYRAIQNCTNKATVKCDGSKDNAHVGGICGGCGEAGSVEKCKNLGAVSGGLYAGGISGSGSYRNLGSEEYNSIVF